MPDSTTPAPTRLLSLDALRGFDMCWILGLSAVVTQMLSRAFPNNEAVSDLAAQFTHVKWDGFRFYDLIFPLFLFLAGVSLAIAVPRRVARDGRGAAVRHLLARAGILVALGIIFSGGVKNGWDQIRWLGVLQRIGIASAAAGILSLWLKPRGLIVASASLLIGYFLLLRFIPVPGIGSGNFAEGMNLTNYLDSLWLPGRKYDGDHDPEGILSTLPAIATALLGLLAGKWITSDAAPIRKTGGLITAGLIMLALGWAWHPFFPIIKKSGPPASSSSPQAGAPSCSAPFISSSTSSAGVAASLPFSGSAPIPSPSTSAPASASSAPSASDSSPLPRPLTTGSPPP